ncbi:unnamed protein product [Bursaphelenchus okinawaensis]|uniref:PXA domain-containing protein n=1 Tax=Bursaphelenchus okinawaensis TaxID=465554 RepID=A0A811K9F3_9BILA|nr:unnamed protein product [Bursaphelenchus okinawaensis]CAG9095091.1 unnamed protein product [Bursaphelenchus okinawaensis]
MNWNEAKFYIVPSTVVLLLLLWKWPILTLLATVTLCGSFYISYNFLSNADKRRKLDDLIAHYLCEEPEAKATKEEFLKTAPWCGIELPETLHARIEELILYLISDYVDRWYKKEISADNTFLVEIKYQIRYGSAIAYRALLNYDIVKTVEQDFLPILVLHVAKRLKTLKEVNNHIGVTDQNNCELYLREVSDALVMRLFDENRIGGRELDSEAPKDTKLAWPSETCRHFLRELFLNAVLLPVIEFLSEPNNINNLLINISNDSPQNEKISFQNDKKVAFLQKLTEYSLYDTPDSLLMLNLRDLAKDCGLVQEFYAYLKDANGPLHWLDFYFAVEEMLHDLHTASADEEILKSARGLYNIYIDPKSRKSVQLLSQNSRGHCFKAISEENVKDLNVVCEQMYKEVYQELNYSFVVPFCQSETYLRSLCGTTIDGIEILKEKAGSINIDNNKNDTVEEEAKALEAIDASFLDIYIDLYEDTIDMNNWKVSIAAIEPRKRFDTGKVYYVYRIDIDKNEKESELEDIDMGVDPLTVNNLSDSDDDFVDCSREATMSQLPSKWSITRTYDEFYLFEKRLRKIHGSEGVLATLPERKMFCPRSRMFLESQRDYLERFLYSIVKQVTLRKSEVVYLFLTNPSDSGFESALITTKGSLKRVKKMTASLEMDRKQHLKPFVLRLLAKCLSNDEVARTEVAATVNYCKTDPSEYWKSEFSNYVVNNQKIPIEIRNLQWERASDEQKTIYYFNTVVLCDIFSTSTIFTYLITAIAKVLPSTCNVILQKVIKRNVERVLTPETVYIVVDELYKFLQRKDVESIIDEKKHENYLTAKKTVLNLLKFNHFESLNTLILDIFNIFQSKEDNKQLIMVCLDVIMDKIISQS